MRDDLRGVRVAAAIIMHEGRVLACQRDDVEGDGGWELPGGKISEGEEPDAACRREVAEELGVRLKAAFFYDTVEEDLEDGRHMSMDAFICELPEGEVPQKSVHRDMRWLSHDDLMEVEWLPADRRVVLSLGVMWDNVLSPEHL